MATRYLIDVATWQGPLKIEDVVRAGFTAVNLKISHGGGRTSVHPDVAGWVTRAKAAGVGISTFHFLTGAATGRAQADYAYSRMRALGLAVGTAHQVDCESDATEAILRDYTIRMQEILGRPVIIYSADWWWASRGWPGAELTPYLWAAPNDPAVADPAFPAAWAAGYGGWTDLSVLQYAVAPLIFPDGSKGTIKVSKSAIRDPAVWSALTGGGGMATWTLTAGLQNLRDQVNDRWPDRDRESDGSIGDIAHQSSTSSHNRDDTAGSRPAWDGDPDSTPEVRAWDMDTDLREPGASALMVVDHIRRLPGIAGVLRYIIYDRRMYHSRDGFASTAYDGPSPHTEHIHFEGAWSQAADNNTSFDFNLWEVGMAEVGLTDAAVQKIANKISLDIQPVNDGSGIAKGLRHQVAAAVDAKLGAILAAVAGVDEEVMAKLSDPSTPNEQVAAALVSLLGDRKDAILALMR